MAGNCRRCCADHIFVQWALSIGQEKASYRAPRDTHLQDEPLGGRRRGGSGPDVPGRWRRRGGRRRGGRRGGGRRRGGRRPAAAAGRRLRRRRRRRRRPCGPGTRRGEGKSEKVSRRRTAIFHLTFTSRPPVRTPGRLPPPLRPSFPPTALRRARPRYTPTGYRAYVRWTLSISCRPNKGLFPSVRRRLSLHIYIHIYSS